MPDRLLKAKFRGQQVPGAFKKGLNYNLSFQIDNNRNPNNPPSVWVSTTTEPKIHRRYDSLDEFWDNWTDIKPR